jgi:hypothetical protein
MQNLYLPKREEREEREERDERDERIGGSHYGCF